MQGNDLVTENVASWSNVGWDGKRPGVVVSNQLIRGPVSRDSGVIDKTNSINLEELQSSLVNCGAVAIAVGEIINNRSVVGLWPYSPLKIDGSSCSNSC